MATIDSASISKHEQIANDLLLRIKAGEFPDRLPNCHELSRLFGVNFKTVSKALGILREARIVVSKRGLGVFVHPKYRDRITSECFFVFPGHKAITDEANPGRHLLLYVLEGMLSAGHKHHAEIRLLPISPENDGNINWRLLNNLRQNDCVAFMGLQYWDVIMRVKQAGGRCLVHNDNPLVAARTAPSDVPPVMSFDIDYPATLAAAAEHLARKDCRHLAAVGMFDDCVWPPLLACLGDSCRRLGIQFGQGDVIQMPSSAEDLHRRLDEASRVGPEVDGLFVNSEIMAREIRDFLGADLPLRIIALDIFNTWQEGDHGIDALRKPHAEMIEQIMQVACGERPFRLGHVAFPTRLREAAPRPSGETAPGKSADARP